MSGQTTVQETSGGEAVATDRSGALLWLLWGTLLGIGLLGLFSIGLPILLLGLALLPSLRGRSGAPVALIGLGAPWFLFSVEGMVSPDCVDGIARIGRFGREEFTCREFAQASEFLPFLLISGLAMAAGLALYVRSRRT